MASDQIESRAINDEKTRNFQRTVKILGLAPGQPETTVFLIVGSYCSQALHRQRLTSSHENLPSQSSFHPEALNVYSQ